MTRIDVHAHFFPQQYVSRLSAEGKSVSSNVLRARYGRVGLAERLELMSQAEVDLQVLSVSSLMPDLPDPRRATSAASLANDLLAEECRNSGGRLAAFGVLPLPHVELAIAEAHRCLDVLHLWGVTFGCSPGGLGIDHPDFRPLFEELDRSAAVVFLHPEGRAATEIAELGLTWSVGALMEDTLAALRLVKSGMTESFPRIRFIVPHLGGVLPMLLARLPDGLVSGGPAGRRRLAGDRSSLWFDTVNGDPAALRCAVQAFGVDRLLFGSDFPFVPDDDYGSCPDRIRAAGLTDGELGQIFGTNARALLLRD